MRRHASLNADYTSSGKAGFAGRLFTIAQAKFQRTRDDKNPLSRVLSREKIYAALSDVPPTRKCINVERHHRKGFFFRGRFKSSKKRFNLLLENRLQKMAGGSKNGLGRG